MNDCLIFYRCNSLKMGYNKEKNISLKMTKFLYYILKAQATAIAIANIGCSIHTLYQGHSREFEVFGENGFKNVTIHEKLKSDTSFSGAIAALVTNMLLTIGIYSEIDLFFYIWLFVYGSFWVVFVFVAPEAYHKLPGISHYFATMISEKYHLDERDRPKIYTCLKFISCLVIILLLYVRTKTILVHKRKDTCSVGTQMPNKSRAHRSRV